MSGTGLRSRIESDRRVSGFRVALPGLNVEA